MVNHLLYEFMVPPTSRQSQKQRNELSQMDEMDEYKSAMKSPRHKLN
jgi:hypothetical protein